jgi:hypothetical protein
VNLPPPNGTEKIVPDVYLVSSLVPAITKVGTLILCNS